MTDLFSAALECDPVVREALLQQMCSGDPELRSEVERLLSSDDQASAHDFLRSSTLAGPDRSPDNPVRKIMENLEFRIDAPTPARDKRPEKPASEMPTLSQEAHWGLVTSAQAGDSAQARGDWPSSARTTGIRSTPTSGGVAIRRSRPRS